MTDVIRTRIEDDVGMQGPVPLSPSDPIFIRPNIPPVDALPTEQLVAEKISRVGLTFD